MERVGRPRGQRFAIGGSWLPRGLKQSIAQQPVTNSRHSDQEVWCVIGNVAMGEIKSTPVIHGDHARVNSDQSRPWGESPVLWPFPFLPGPSQEGSKSRVRTGSEKAIHAMLGPENESPSLDLEPSSNILHCQALGHIPKCRGPLCVLISTV